MGSEWKDDLHNKMSHAQLPKIEPDSEAICLIIDYSESPYTFKVKVEAAESRKHLVEGP